MNVTPTEDVQSESVSFFAFKDVDVVDEDRVVVVVPRIFPEKMKSGRRFELSSMRIFA